MLTIRRIDYYGGLHGQYLELIVNHCIDQNPYPLSTKLFKDTGSCHVKCEDHNYVPITKAWHYGYYNETVEEDAYMIRIVPEQEDLLIAVTNSFLRAGDVPLDLDCLEINTLEKLSDPKFSGLRSLIIDKLGNYTSYSRSKFRNHFYSMFCEPEYGLKLMTNWAPSNATHNFKFRGFFSFDLFFEELQKVANFVNLRFTPTKELITVHQHFLNINHGLISEQKCQEIMNAIIKGEDLPINLNVIEEGWINCKIAKSFNVFDHELLTQDIYPKSTQEIHSALF